MPGLCFALCANFHVINTSVQTAYSFLKIQLELTCAEVTMAVRESYGINYFHAF